MRYEKVRKVLMFWSLFIGIGALFGGILMLIKPSGELLKMGGLLKYFKILPFSDVLFKDYVFSGISLIIVNGITNIICFYFLLKKSNLGNKFSMIFGITLMMWITIQFIILPMNFMSISFFIIGFIQFITGYMGYVFYKQNEFTFDESLYKNIGKDKSVLVVYFSRMGYTKKIAYSIADKYKSDILELTTSEKTDGTSGFWWCGKYSMNKSRMPINEVNKDISSYKKVIIVSPIWNGSICAVVRDFLYKYKSDIKVVEYVITHFMDYSFNSVRDELDNILGKKSTKFTSICVRFGEIIKLN